MNIGAVGWAVKTGIGYELKDMWDLGLLTKWLIPEHPKLGIDAGMAPANATRCRVLKSKSTFMSFLKDLDVLLIIERPLLTDFDMVAEAIRRHCLVVCLPHMEWLPRPHQAPWVRYVHGMWAPTGWTQSQLQEVAKQARARGWACKWEQHIWGGRWGVNLKRFPFTSRVRCERFLFCNGWGGFGNRKGINVVVDAARLVPDIPIVLRTQKELGSLPTNIQTLQSTENPAELYSVGDIFLAPSRWEGVGLQLYEAQACGLPVFTTNGPPMHECRPLERIQFKTGSDRLHDRMVVAYEAEPQHLADLMRAWYGQPIKHQSEAARINMEKFCDLEQTFVEMRTRFQLSSKDVRSGSP